MSSDAALLELLRARLDALLAGDTALGSDDAVGVAHGVHQRMAADRIFDRAVENAVQLG